MTIIEGIFHRSGTSAHTWPERHRLFRRPMAKAAERIVASLVPTPEAADEGKVLTANDDGTADWAAIPAE